MQHVLTLNYMLLSKLFQKMNCVRNRYQKAFEKILKEQSTLIKRSVAVYLKGVDCVVL